MSVLPKRNRGGARTEHRSAKPPGRDYQSTVVTTQQRKQISFMLFVGLDIGGTNIKAGVLDGDTGDLIVGPLQDSLPKDRSPEAVVEKLIALAESLFDKQEFTWEDTLYVGIACPGQIDREAGVVVGASAFLSWSNVPLAALVQDKIGRPVTVLNDASAAASAEFASRGGQETIAVLTLGTGIGLGVVCAGRVMTGSRALIEGGHMIVEPGPEGRPCACGQRGCLEAYASASAVAAIASERLGGTCPPSPGAVVAMPAAEEVVAAAEAAAGPEAGAGLASSSEAPVGESRWGPGSPASPCTPSLASPGLSRRKRSMSRSDSAVSLRIRELERRASESEERATVSGSPASPRASAAVGRLLGPTMITAADVFAMAKQGDEIAVRVVAETCDYLGLACVNICRVLDPDAILLTGGLSKAEGLVEKVREAFSSRGWTVLPHECEIDLASTCVAAGVIGAGGAAASEYARAKRRHRRRSSEGGVMPAPDALGSGSDDKGMTVGKRGGRAWGLFLVGVAVGAIVSSVAAVALSGRDGRISTR